MRPPRLARFLAALATPAEDRRFVLQDLEDGFARVCDAKGAGAARRWYWWQAVRGVAARMRPDPSAGFLGVRNVLSGDARVVIRGLFRRPLYALGSVGALALGLTSAASVFAVAWHVWLAPLPIPEPEQVVRVFELGRLPGDGGEASGERERLWISPPLLEDFRRHEWGALKAVAGLAQDNHDWARDDEAVQLSALRTTPELADVLGLVPLFGRFLAEEPGEPQVVLSEPFWLRAFGGDPGVVGRETMELDGAAHRVVGVVRLPAGYPRGADVLTRLTFDEAQLTDGWRGARYLEGVARMRPGRTVAEAARELDAFVVGLGQAHPQHRGRGGTAVSLGSDLAAPYRGVLTLLLLAGGAFLALAVVNVSGLVVIRRAQARQERGIRAALGASRQRLLAGDLTETLTLGSAAGLGGVLFTYWIITPVMSLVPSGAPRMDQVSMDPLLAGLLLGGGVLVGAVVGLVGHAFTPTPLAVGRSPASSSGLWGRRALVVGQVALTTLLATGGVAVLRYVQDLRSVDMGFEPEGVLTRMVMLSQSRYPSDEALATAWDGILAGLEARGISSAVGANPPITGSSMRYGYRFPDRPDEELYAQYHAVTAKYFQLLGMELLDGRSVEATDVLGSEPVVVVSDAVARKMRPDGRVVGETLRLVGTDRRVVGVVASTRHFGPDTDIPDEVYVPLRQDKGASFGYVLMRTEVEDAGAIMEDVLASVDPSLTPMPTLSFTDHVAAWFAPLTLQLYVVMALGGVGLLLASLGLYALVAYQVSLRRREIGIRKALGAPVAGLFRGVVLQGGALAGAGLVLGLAAWYLLLPVLAQVVVGIGEGDVVVPVLVAGVVALVSVLATSVPAWRSSAVDPSIALQSE